MIVLSTDESQDSFDDIAKSTIYVVDWSAEKMPLLGEPDLMVEVEATAVLPAA